MVETLPLDGQEEQTEDPKMNHEEGHGQEEQIEVPEVNHEEGQTTADEARYTFAF